MKRDRIAVSKSTHSGDAEGRGPHALCVGTGQRFVAADDASRVEFGDDAASFQPPARYSRQVSELNDEALRDSTSAPR